MTIDVIIPVKDIDMFLSEAVHSALNQEGVTTEVIIVDGGSDSPIQLSPELDNNPRVRLIRSERALTAGGGRNVGYVNSHSPYIAFLDADDVWPSTRSRVLLEELQRTEADLATGMMEHFRNSSTDSHLVVPEGVLTAYSAGGILMPRHTMDIVGLFDESLNAGEFIHWHNRLISLGLRESCISDCVLHRRVHSHSSTVASSHHRVDYLKVVREWMNQNNS